MSETTRGGGCRIHLVRHGRTVMNAQVRFRGVLDVPLDEVGLAEAKATGEALSKRPIAAVYSSPLQRAVVVGESIANACALPQVETLPALINVDYGAWEGLTKEECADRDPELFRLYAEEPEAAYCPDGEALATAADRAISALREIGDRHQGQEVAAVTHGAMVRLAVLRVAGPAIGDWQFKLPTGSATVFDVTPSEIMLISAPNRLLADPIKGARRSRGAAAAAR